MKKMILKVVIISSLCYGVVNPYLALGHAIHACNSYDQCVETYCTPGQFNNFYFKSPACINEDVPLDHRKEYFNTTPILQACRKEADECLKQYFCMNIPTAGDLTANYIDEGNAESASGRLRGGGNRSTDKEERKFLFCPAGSTDCEPERIKQLCDNFYIILITTLGNLLL